MDQGFEATPLVRTDRSQDQAGDGLDMVRGEFPFIRRGWPVEDISLCTDRAIDMSQFIVGPAKTMSLQIGIEIVPQVFIIKVRCRFRLSHESTDVAHL